MSIEGTIAIDGYSGCGKSTLARDLATRLMYLHIDTGAMYRAITYDLLSKGLIPPYKEERISSRLKQLDLSVFLDGNSQRTCVDGSDITEDLYKLNVAEHVSQVAAMPEVREFLVQKQQKLSGKGRVVMDGRDIGTVVLPDADIKLFINAEIEERIRRRMDELAVKGIHLSAKEVRKNLEQRDYIDTNREESPLCKAPDAIVLDTTNLTREEQLEMVLALVKERLNS